MMRKIRRIFRHTTPASNLSPNKTDEYSPTSSNSDSNPADDSSPYIKTVSSSMKRQLFTGIDDLHSLIDFLLLIGITDQG